MTSTAYLIVKSLHIISMVAWMAGILYLFRLFVYHSMEKENVVKERFKIMEYRLYKYITMPAMVATYVFGVTMLIMQPSLFSQGWLHVKLLGVFGLTGISHYAGAQMDKLANGTCTTSTKTFRILNEVPTLILVVVVFLVVLKPW